MVVDPRNLRTFEQAAQELPWATVHGLRHLRRQAPEIGLEGVFVQLGGRVLVNVDLLGERLGAAR